MFGAGIYCASVPQKSSDYGSYILICDVAVGRKRKVHSAKPRLDPERELNKKYMFGLWKVKYDSVHAPAGSSTISDEHIVFTPEYVLPRYVIEVQKN